MTTNTIEQKQVCIFFDEKHVNETTAAFDQAITNARQAITAYKELTGETDLTPDQFSRLLVSPSRLVHEVITGKVKVPAGMSADQWLKLIEIPDCSQLAGLVSDPFCDPVFLSYDGKDITLSETAKKTITRKNVYVSEHGNEIFLAAIRFTEALNNLRQYKSYATDSMFNPAGHTMLKQDYHTKQWAVDMERFAANFL